MPDIRNDTRSESAVEITRLFSLPARRTVVLLFGRSPMARNQKRYARSRSRIRMSFARSSKGCAEYCRHWDMQLSPVRSLPPLAVSGRVWSRVGEKTNVTPSLRRLVKGPTPRCAATRGRITMRSLDDVFAALPAPPFPIRGT